MANGCIVKKNFGYFLIIHIPDRLFLYLEAEDEVDMAMHLLDDAVRVGVGTDVPEDAEAAEEEALKEKFQQYEERVRPSLVVGLQTTDYKLTCMYQGCANSIFKIRNMNFFFKIRNRNTEWVQNPEYSGIWNPELAHSC
jgi:hypothetical protein